MRRGLIYGIVLWAVLTLGFKLIVDGDIIRLDGASLRVVLPLIGVGLADHHRIGPARRLSAL